MERGLGVAIVGISAQLYAVLLAPSGMVAFVVGTVGLGLAIWGGMTAEEMHRNTAVRSAVRVS